MKTKIAIALALLSLAATALLHERTQAALKKLKKQVQDELELNRLAKEYGILHKPGKHYRPEPPATNPTPTRA